MRRKTLSSLRFPGRIITCLLLWLFTTIALPASASDPVKQLLIGIEPEHNIFDQMQRYRTLANYLSDQLGVRVNLTIMSRYGEVLKRFKSLKLDGAFLTPYTASMAIAELNLEPLVNPVNLSGTSISQGYIFVRQDSDIQDIKDMEGKNIVLVDQATMEGYLFPLVYLSRAGINDINQYFNRIIYSGSHASAIFTVLDGRADIGATKNTVFNKIIHNDQTIERELRIIARSPDVPEFTLCIKTGIDRNLRERLGSILLQMNNNPAGKETLTQFGALRFIKSNKADFVKIEEMQQEALPGQSKE